LPLSGALSERQIDAAVVAAAVALSLPGVIHSARHDRLALALLLLPLSTLPLLWRRRYPGAVLAILLAVFLGAAAGGRAMPGNAGLLFAIYAAALYGGPQTRAISCGLACAAALTAFGLLLATDHARLFPHFTAPIALGAGGAWLLGEAARTRRAYVAELEREREDHARRAAEEERIRIARELHDVVTHHVSVIAIQAGAAHSTAAERPERAMETLGLIERTARTTLSELRTLLVVLRAGDGQPPLVPLRPHASLTELDELVAQAQSAGISVHMDVRGDPGELDALVELGAYRVLQEALTNVVKHAPGSHAELLVDYGEEELTVRVTDDGPGCEQALPNGHGLLGMRERVELTGGTLRAGTMLGGGFRVEARLPRQSTRAREVTAT
jgi:signal transduction histidine kinase